MIEHGRRQETIRRARQTNLAEYLISKGVPLKYNGTRYRHPEHESLVFTENAYYWNTRGEHGNAIDYLMRHMSMDFKTALFELTSNANIVGQREQSSSQRHFEFDVDLEPNMRRSIAYLNKSRGIDYRIVQWLIKNKLLYQEAKTNNIIFPIYDENKSVVGAELQGTLTNADKRFKGVKTGSKYGYGYNISPTQSDTIKYVLFFESAVDLLSFWDIKKTEEKTLADCLLVSMMGVKENVFKQMLSIARGMVKPVLCVDNDEAGQTFIKTIKAHNGEVEILTPLQNYKDWNDQLKNLKGINT